MDNEEVQGVKFSEFPSATPDNADEVVGLHSRDNVRFSVANFVLAVRQGLSNLFVPLTRKINNKALSADITLDASDIGAVPNTRKVNNKPLSSDITLDASDVGAVDTADVGVADGVASLDSNGKVPTSQLPPIASTATDVTYDNTTSGLSATNVQDAVDEVYGDIPTDASDISYDNQASGLQATNVQGAIDEGISLAASLIPSPSDATPQALGTAAPGVSTLYSRSDHVHPTDTSRQAAITASGILKGDGVGGVSAATAGTDYQAPLTAGTDYATPAMIPSVPSAYTGNPEMDGTASPGSSGAWAKGDHVHPSDTSKANQAQLAYVETGTTASRNYAIGEYLCWNGLLYRAKTAISSGAAFTVGTNIADTVNGSTNEMILQVQTIPQTVLDAGLNVVDIPSAVTGYYPVVVSPYGLTNNFAMMFGSTRYILNRGWVVSVYSAQGSNRISGTVRILFAKAYG